VTEDLPIGKGLFVKGTTHTQESQTYIYVVFEPTIRFLENLP